MATAKFKVGDIVKGIGKTRYYVTDDNMTRGQVIDIRDSEIRVKVLEHKTMRYEIGNCYWVLPEYFELVPNDTNWKVVIIPDGDTTIGKLYEGDKVVKEVTTRKSPSDKYSKEDAIKVIVERLTAPTYYNGKVVCVDAHSELFTTGKIYNIVDGKIFYNDGTPYTGIMSIDKLNKIMISKFIEVVE